MTQEEKAKAYDEAKARMSRAFNSNRCTIGFMNEIFPELNESEDEKIKREIITYLSTAEDKEFIPYESWIAWLEKQKIDKEINLVEILKHYPKETELYSPLYGKLWLAEVDEKNETITCYKHRLEEGCTRAVLEQEDTVSFYSNGTTGLPDFNVSKHCMLFLYDIEKQGRVQPKVELIQLGKIS